MTLDFPTTSIPYTVETPNNPILDMIMSSHNLNRRPSNAYSNTTVELPAKFQSMPRPNSYTESFPKAKIHSFLIALARDFAVYGAPAHRLDHHLVSVSNSLGMEGSSFIILPGVILIQFCSSFESDETGKIESYTTSSVHLVKIPPPQHHLAKLSAVNAMCREIECENLTIQEAWDRLHKINKRYVYDLSAFRDGLRDPSGPSFRENISTQTWYSRLLRFLTGFRYPIRRLTITFPMISFACCLILLYVSFPYF